VAGNPDLAGSFAEPRKKLLAQMDAERLSEQEEDSARNTRFE
jgi:hypothetical protein